MKRRILVLFLTIYCFTCLIAMSEYGVIFIALNPSARTYGMGIDVGSADFWHNDAFISYDNPALSSLHQGIYYTINKVHWLDDVPGVDDMYFYNGYVNLAWKGFGLSFPMYNSSKGFGSYFDYGKQERTDENGFILSQFNANEQALRYNLSVNSSIIKNLPENFLFGAGITYIDIRSNLAPDGIGLSEPYRITTAKANCLNLGLFAKFNFRDAIMPKSRFETGIGYNAINFSNKTIKYKNELQKDKIYSDESVGFSARFSIPQNGASSELFYTSPDGSGDLVSLQIAINQRNVLNTTPIQSWGTEIGLFNILFCRLGYYDDPDGRITGHTKGYGLKYTLNKYNVQINYAKFPGGELQDSQDDWDFTLGYKF